MVVAIISKKMENRFFLSYFILVSKKLQPRPSISLMNLKTAVYPRKTRKTRKTRNKSVRCINLAIHHLGGGLQLGISLKFFVLFVVFVDEMIFLG